MKKYIKYALLLMAVVILGSCSKEDIPMTSTVDLAGEWMVTADVVVDGEVYPDYYGIGQFMILTYNTSADNGKELFVDDIENFWGTKAVIPCELSSLSFGSSTPVLNERKGAEYDDDGKVIGYYDYDVTITQGKITPNGATTPSGMPADAIEFHIEFSDDPGTDYYIHGYRRTGFVADE